MAAKDSFEISDGESPKELTEVTCGLDEFEVNVEGLGGQPPSVGELSTRNETETEQPGKQGLSFGTFRQACPEWMPKHASLSASSLSTRYEIHTSQQKDGDKMHLLYDESTRKFQKLVVLQQSASGAEPSLVTEALLNSTESSEIAPDVHSTTQMPVLGESQARVAGLPQHTLGISPQFLARHSTDQSLFGGTERNDAAPSNDQTRTTNPQISDTRSQMRPAVDGQNLFLVGDTYPNHRNMLTEQDDTGHRENDKDAKLEVRPRDDIGIEPCFLARHSEDSSITTPIDDMRNAEEKDDPRIIAIAPHALINGDSPLAQAPLLPQQRKVKDQPTDPEVQRERNSDFEVINGNPACLSDTTAVAQGLISPEMEISALPQAAMNTNLIWETGTHADQDTAYQKPLGVLNDDSLADPERRVAEASFPVETTLKEREVREKAMKEEERTRKEQQARERGEREATEARGIEHNNLTEEGSSTSSGEETLEQLIIQGTSRLERKWREREKEWMEKKGWTRKERSQDRQTKCCNCRVLKDHSSHCDQCNVCINNGLEGRHNRRPNSGHDVCCICLENMFGDCQILSCLHKVHRECAIAMTQNEVHSCPICRRPLCSQTNGNE